MAVEVEIQGVGTVEFDDSFKKLSPDEQQQLVNRVASMQNLSTSSASSQSNKPSKPERETSREDLLRAGLQGLMFGFSDEAAGLLKGVYDKAVEGKDFSEAYEEARDEERRKLAEFRESDPVAAYGAEILGSLPTAFAGGGLATAARLGGKGLGTAIARGGVEGGIYGFGAGEGDLEDQAKSVAIGTGTGAGVTGAVGGLLRSTIAPAATKEAQMLMDKGVKLTPGQQAPNSVIGMVDQGLGKIPPIRAAQQAAVPEFNRAAMDDALASIGQKTPKNAEGGAIIQFGKEKFDEAYNEIKPQIHVPDLNAVKMQGANILNQIDDLNPAAKNTLQKEFTNFLNRKGMKKATKLDGAAFKEIDSIMGKRAAAYQRVAAAGTDVNAGDVAKGLFAMQKALRDGVVGKTDAATKKLANINKGYSKFGIVRDAAQRAGGEFSPAKLAQASKKGDLSPGKQRTAMGTANMQPLANAGQVALRQLPDSGTPFGVAMGGAAIDPGIAARMGAAGMLSPFYRPIMRGLLGTSRIARSGTEAAAPAVGGISGGLLSQ